jgi:hypothetical protein
MRDYTKTLNRQQLKQALRKFYGNGRNLNYAYQTVDAAVDKNWTGVNNLCMTTEGGYFSFTYQGNKEFKCSTTYPELLRV